MSRHRKRFMSAQRLKHLGGALAVVTATAALIFAATGALTLVGLPFHKALTVAVFASWVVLAVDDVRRSIKDAPNDTEPEEASA